MTDRPLRLGIDGMTCAGCAGRAERALAAVPGVRAARVNLATETAEVTGGTPGSLAEALSRAGYPAREDIVRLCLSGMHCTACKGRIEAALAAVPGVLSVHVNVASDTAEVRTLRGVADTARLIGAVEAAGYGARPAKGGATHRHATSGLRRDLVIAAALTLPVFVLEMGGHLWPALHHWTQSTLGPAWAWMQFALVTAVLAGPGRRFFSIGLRRLAVRAPDMNSLVALGAGAAYVYSTVATIAPSLLPEMARAVYFEAAAVIVTLILLGRWLEARAKGRAGEAIRALIARRPSVARVRRDGRAIEIDVDAVVPGDVLELRPGETVPVDGVIVEGETRIDESMLTGEAVPVAKAPGDPVTGGTVNGHGALGIRATAVGEGTTLARIVRMVETAQGATLPVEALTDRVVRVFVPVVLGIAALTVALWLAVGPGPTHALVAGVSVLIIACPCAMGLATPVSILVGTGRAAELGVLFRRGDALQRLAGVRTVAFDKTGTLTEGRPVLAMREPASGKDVAAVLRRVAAAERGSEHPIARALEAAAEGDLPTAEAVEALAGRGISARVEGRNLLIGSPRLMAEHDIDTAPLAQALDRAGTRMETPVLVAEDGEIAALFTVSDPVKPNAADAVAMLAAAGLRTVLLTGDCPRVARAVAARLGIDDVRARLLPEDKAEAVTALTQAQGPVAFVGDGINDAPALAAAEVGIAIGTGTDIAIEAGDVVLVSGDVAGVATARHLSRRTMANIRGNLVWAFGYNILLIPVAAGVFYPAFGMLLSPMLAAAAMALSSVLVVTNALRLRRVKAPLSPSGAAASHRLEGVAA